MYWDFSRGGYGMLAPDGSEQPALLDALVRPYPARTAGDPIAYGFDGAAFTFSYRPDGSKLATEIVVPARVFPDGYDVDCGGCAYEIVAGALRITRAAGSPTTVVLRARP
jgi:hypothetical protein